MKCGSKILIVINILFKNRFYFLQAEQIPEFNADKVALQVPDAVFGPAFNIANGASQVLGTIIQVKYYKI